MHLRLTVECITSGLHLAVFQGGLNPPPLHTLHVWIPCETRRAVLHSTLHCSFSQGLRTLICAKRTLAKGFFEPWHDKWTAATKEMGMWPYAGLLS